MRYTACLFVAAAACGEVKQQRLPDGPPAPDDAGLDAPIDTPAACTTFNSAWQTNAISFDTDIAPTARADFETRGDGITGVTAGTPVPRDEYLACCGFRLDYLGPAGGQLIWAGNAVGGFEVRASCQTFPCPSPAGIRVTFVPPVTAVGVDYPGGIDAAMFNAQNNLISSMSVMGSGNNFLGYKSAVPIDHAEVTDGGGENIQRLLYHRCP